MSQSLKCPATAGIVSQTDPVRASNLAGRGCGSQRDDAHFLEPRRGSTARPARRHLERMPGAISGSDGHVTTFRAAVAMVRGFRTRAR
jgi:hypothetical protein